MTHSSDDENSTNQQQQQAQEANAASSAGAASYPGISVLDEQDVDYLSLDRNLVRLLKIIEQPWEGKETFPAVKLNREQVEFLMKEMMLSKSEAEGLLTRAGGDLKAAVSTFMDSPLSASYKI